MIDPELPSPSDWQGRACAWPPRPQRTDRVRLITPDELRRWIVHEDAELLVINKSGDVVCHPSKAGPWSSLIGAAREYTGLERVHLIFRLDRETSGVVVMAKNSESASRLQQAVQRRQIRKTYLSILTGELHGSQAVDQPLGPDDSSPVFVKDCVRPDGREARSLFTPLATGGGFTLARVRIETGRKHQIRAHAQWLGHAVVGDKIYGPDARLYLDFIDTGWTAALAERLLLARQALHCARIDLAPAGLPWSFQAPLPEDMSEFVQTRMGLAVNELAAAQARVGEDQGG